MSIWIAYEWGFKEIISLESRVKENKLLHIKDLHIGISRDDRQLGVIEEGDIRDHNLIGLDDIEMSKVWSGVDELGVDIREIIDRL